MGPVEEKIYLDSDEEIPFSSTLVMRKVHAFDSPTTYLYSRADMTYSNFFKQKRMGLLRSIYAVLFKPKINLLIPFGPLAIMLHHVTTGQPERVFFFSLLGITPLAMRLDYVTEQFAFYSGPTVGVLLNAIFGNATELLISIYALNNGMIRVVQQSLLGSILSNMLLVLGCSFFIGGIIHHKKVQVFNKASAVMNNGLLLIAVMGITFPAVLHFTHTEAHFGKSELELSRFSSFVMLIAYSSYLFFQLKSQPKLHNSVHEEKGNYGGDSDDEEAPEITQREAIGWLAILTLWVSIMSVFLVDNMQGASDSLNLPMTFINVILLPLVEHAAAIKFAMKDKLDITIEVAIGSALRVSLFLIPFCVLVGWLMGHPMDLNFQLPETATFLISVLMVTFMLQEGTSCYFKGLMLILGYLIVAAKSYYHDDE